MVPGSKAFWYAAIVAFYLGECALIAWHGVPQLPIWMWAIYPFAVLRLGRLLAYDVVMQPFRALFGVEVVPHDSGAGDTTASRGGDNLQGALGDLLTCPICSGTHAGTILLGLFSFVPAFGIVLLLAAFGIGAAEVIDALLEGAQWHGEAARKQVGQAYWVMPSGVQAARTITASFKGEENDVHLA
jgi:hypothetical protein